MTLIIILIPVIGHTQRIWCSTVKISIFTKVTLTFIHDDLGTQTWPRYDQDITSYRKWSFYVKAFKSYSPDRQTYRQTHTQYENITFPHIWVVINMKLKEFQSLENDVCHTVVFGNIATVVTSCKMLHWMQMADGSNVF